MGVIKMKAYEEILEEMGKSGIIPVVVIDNSDDAAGLGEALLEAGIRIIEITLRTKAGLEAIRKLKASGLDIRVGAGTVLTVEMAEKAAEAGASFLISPGFDGEVVAWAVKNEVPIFPGIATPSEIIQAMKFGLKAVKFFPAEAIGGTKLLKALAGPYPDLKFIPTGGISEKNIGEYMAIPSVAACGGSWICPARLIREHRFDEITEIGRAHV